MTPLALAVLASVFIASHGKWDHPIWQNESRLQEYQIAWKSLNKSSDVTYYQLRATELISGSILTNKEQLLETNYSCWSVNMLNLKQDKEKGVRRYHYMVTATGAVHIGSAEVMEGILYKNTQQGLKHEVNSQCGKIVSKHALTFNKEKSSQS
uniref:Lipocalin n=1 Tax=Rhipicephalus zambeziensis TaxID=60191 RepID=A0A224YC49_9ACAR